MTGQRVWLGIAWLAGMVSAAVGVTAWLAVRYAKEVRR